MLLRNTNRKKPELLPNQKELRLLVWLAGVLCLLAAAGLFWVVNTTYFLTH